jgi:hypothetical protein
MESIVMADTSLAQTLQNAVITLALRAAREEVKQAIRAEGRRKLQTIPHREISLAVREHLAGHPELVAEARLTARQWAAEAVFGKRVAAQVKALIAELERNSRGMSKEERPAMQGLLLNETHAQNGAVK